MISNAYIHSTDLQEEFLFESHHLLNSISDEMQKLIGLEQEIEEAAMFGESVEDFIPYYEAESKNIFERIGESLISLTKSFIKMVSNIVSNIKNAIGSSQKVVKSNAIKEAINANPGLADEFLRSVTAGNIKCNDVKDFDELVSEAAKISKDYANGKLGKQSFSDKMDSILASFSRKAKPIAELLDNDSYIIDYSIYANGRSSDYDPLFEINVNTQDGKNVWIVVKHYSGSYYLAAYQNRILDQGHKIYGDYAKYENQINKHTYFNMKLGFGRGAKQDATLKNLLDIWWEQLMQDIKDYRMK